MSETMQVVRYYPPGSFEKLRYQTEPVPGAPGAGQAVIAVHGVGLIWPELTWPIYQSPSGEYLPHIPGHDFSGVISSVGSGSDLKVGREVYGLTSRRNHEGAMAQYVKADVDQIVAKPKNLSMIEAAAVPLSALTAWQGLFVHGGLKKGQKVLITGAAGGTGVWAMQFAKWAGADVVGTGSADRSREIVEGFDVKFVDYKTTKLAVVATDMDVVLDCVGGQVTHECLDLVRKDGIVVSIAGFDCAESAKEKGVRGSFFIVRMDADQLNQITKLIEDGEVKVFVDAVYPLEKTKAAFEAASEGHVHGKVVIKVV
ncbi:uncharacterized protein HMPREF1541_07163 [Cyphellophora europaea CBS 101466]|uniref:Enoyl reductase (ER) domain-containing protein n=1 Tax=Cyphellophora europaea (strain CBS 101466) TaxID=1220924 RepID=W2RM04_CYPE1|nr:uncharacterized protein HMPREF1541_07163 [Cyphellophora europaea CBS 101466]ETN37541.1 hypothetical protein HMPREF1541_07163 [Cyphellophora europaea CBS 101466]